MQKVIKSENYKGTIHIPSSKSDAQRALLIASLCAENSILQYVGKSKDELSMIQCAEKMGAELKFLGESRIEIKGIKSLVNDLELNAGESGLGFRMLGSVLASFKSKTILAGEGSLLTRPMNFFEEVLPQLGVKINSAQGKSPIEIEGPLQGGEIEIDGSLSSQFLSGLLIALPLVSGNSIVHVKDLKSKGYIDMTLATLKKFGIQIQNEAYKKFVIEGGQTVKACNYPIEGDWSAASCWLVASALGFEISVRNLNMESFQADRKILEVFKLAKCQILNSNEGIKVDGTNRCSFSFDATDCPDLFPALCTLAALTIGESRIKGSNRLIHKESNRAESIYSEFSKLGVAISLGEDEIIIQGKAEINGGEVDSHNDHRIAMCLAILGMKSKTQICINDAQSVSKSYPDFWSDLNSLIC